MLRKREAAIQQYLKGHHFLFPPLTARNRKYETTYQINIQLSQYRQQIEYIKLYEEG